MKRKIIDRKDTPLAFSIIGMIILTIILHQQLLNLVSVDFMKNFLLVISFSAIGFGFMGIQVEKNKPIKQDLLMAGIYMAFSAFLGLCYIAYPKELLLPITLGTFSMILFLGGFVSLILILVKEKMSI